MRRLKLCFLTLAIFSFSQFSYADVNEDLRVGLLNGNQKEVIATAEGLISSKKATEETYYLLGLAYIENKDYKQARANFDIALNGLKESSLYEKIILAKGDSYFLESDFNNALSTYEQLTRHKTSGENMPLLLLRLTQCNMKEGNWRQGKKILARLKAEYPKSFEASVSDNISTSDEFFCVQVGSFSNLKNAESYARELKSQGFDAYVVDMKVGNTTIYRVRVGECESRQQAEWMKSNLDVLGYKAKIYP